LHGRKYSHAIKKQSNIAHSHSVSCFDVFPFLAYDSSTSPVTPLFPLELSPMSVLEFCCFVLACGTLGLMSFVAMYVIYKISTMVIPAVASGGSAKPMRDIHIHNIHDQSCPGHVDGDMPDEEDAYRWN